ncbi:MAG: hypothetical protein HOJ35_05360 [Bdellovibrionales bacterium]|jgi:nitrate reductase NapAB chaperone NapD|nr:hypothetical protein [Bdellovibrionales bacterium]
MPIQSYLVYPRKDKKQKLLSHLRKLSGCETMESTNEEIIILLTDTSSDFEEGQLQENLKAIPHLEGMALVYAQEG